MKKILITRREDVREIPANGWMAHECGEEDFLSGKTPYLSADSWEDENEE